MQFRSGKQTNIGGRRIELLESASIDAEHGKDNHRLEKGSGKKVDADI